MMTAILVGKPAQIVKGMKNARYYNIICIHIQYCITYTCAQCSLYNDNILFCVRVKV